MSTDFRTETTCRAAKHHRCEHCHGLIRPGEQYLRLAGCYEGDFYSIRAHKECEEIWSAVWSLQDLQAGDMMESLADELYEVKDDLEGRTLIERFNRQALATGGHPVDLEGDDNDQPT